MGLAWWALELQAKLVVKEKQLFELRKERDAAKTAEKQAKADTAPLQENIARLQKERDEAQQVAAKSPTEESNGGLLGGLFKQMESPEMKSVIRSQELAANRKEYGPLLKRWNLSPADTDTVLNFLTDKEIGAALSAMKGEAPTSNDNASAHIKSMLGDERMKELEAFEQALSRTETVSRYAEHLDISGFPLNADQTNQLTDVLQSENGTPAEQSATEAEELKLLSSGVIDDATLAKINKREDDKQTRIIQKAKAFLSPDQVSGLQAAFREENQEREAGMKMVGELMKAGSGTSGTISPGVPKVEIKTKVFVQPTK